MSTTLPRSWLTLSRALLILFIGLLAIPLTWTIAKAAPSPLSPTLAPQTFSCAAVTQIPTSECEALVALYTSTNGTGWTNHDGWLTTTTPCSWFGVTCADGYVEVLELPNNQLNGALPPAIGNLVNLGALVLHNNELSGSIPPALGNLVNIYTLMLSSNQLTGPIPSELGNMTNLEALFLTNNQLSGLIPPSIGNLAKLRGLFLDYNQLSGPIPPALSNLSQLEVIDLSKNVLSGAVPPWLGGLTKLYGLSLSSNKLDGPIPPILGNLTQLQTLRLDNNMLSGEIPPELGRLAELESLRLHNNALMGPIPQSLGNLTNLSDIQLQQNKLNGIIPSQLTQLTNIGIGAFNISYNALMGTAPTLLTWLAQVAPNWQTTQTAPPTNVTVGKLVNGQLTVAWTPIPYTGDGGYYEISYAMQESGPFTVHGTTIDKTAGAYTLTRLSPTTYYIRVRTYTPAHNNNQNPLWSDYSPVVRNAANLLVNGSFETGVPPWLFYSSGGGSLTTAGPAYEGNAAGRVAVRSVSSNVQLYQTGFPLEPQTRYRLRFVAYSSSGHDLALVVHRHSAPYTNYGLNNFRINLSPGWQTFTVAFTTRNLHQSTTDTRLRFWLAPYAQAGDLYWIDGVVLEKVTATDAQITPAVSSYGTVTGTVQLPAGHNGTVTLTLIDLDSDGARFTQTITAASDGAFAFAEVPAGTYELSATGPAGTLLPDPYQFLIGELPNEAMEFKLEPITDTLYLPLINR